jgi:hypothetical protein
MHRLHSGFIREMNFKLEHEQCISAAAPVLVARLAGRNRVARNSHEPAAAAAVSACAAGVCCCLYAI